MKKLTYIGSLLVALLFVSVAAQAQDVVLASIGKSGQTQLEVKFDDKYMNFGTAGGSQEISFKTNTTVTATSSAAWCKAAIADGKVNVTAEASNEENTREAELTISALDGLQQVITVRQLGTKPAFLINEETVNVAGINSRVLLDITSNSELSFALPDWITPVDAATAQGTKTYIFLAGELENNQTRSGDITVSLTADAGQTAKVSVTQTFEGFPKFFVISDTHFGSGDAVSRVTNVLNNLYSFDSDIDAIIVNGDLTDGGQPDQYEQFRSVLEDESILPSYVARYYVMGNHEWLVGENAMENYSVLGQDHNKYFDIKGYPFIYVGLSGGGEQDYSEESYEFLRESLADAAVRYAGRPIFVFTHIPVYGTTHGSGDTDGGWGNKRFYDIFKDYPQIIHFCGHTHFSLRDPKALWQGAFTSIDDGTSNYCYLNPGIDVDGSTPAGTSDVQEGLIVSVEDLTNVNVRRIDSRRGEEIEPAWDFGAPYDGTNMPYASYTGGEAPYFPDTQVTTEEGQSDERTITFPQAVDDDVVLYYKVSVKNSAGEEVATGNRCSSFYLGSEMPETRSITLNGLPQGEELYAEVIAYDPYGNASEPITSETFTVGSYTPAPGTEAPEPDLLDMSISEMGVVSDATGTFIFDHGPVEPLVYVDNTYQRVAAQFQGNTSQYYKLDYSNNQEVKDAMCNEITYETLFRCNEVLSGWHNPLSSMDDGGQGIELDDGRIAFYVGFNNANGDNEYKSISSNVVAQAGVYYHVVATYSKAEGMMRLYIDGFPAGEIAVDGEPRLSAEGAQWVAIGGDASTRMDCDGVFDGQIVVARMYTRAVTRDEVYLMYRTYQDVAESVPGEDDTPAEVAPVADLMDIVFGENGAVQDVSPVATEVLTGNTVPQTYFNETYQRWVAQFSGTDNQEYYAVPYGNSGTVHDAMSGSFSLEVLAVINNPGDNLPAIVSSQQTGGFGIEPGNDIQVWGCFSDRYATAYTGIEPEHGRFYHIIGVYDYDKSEMRVYVDGQAAGSVSVAGLMDYPDGLAQYFCIGGDASFNADIAEYQLEGEVALVRMYSHAINLSEAKKLYNDLQEISAE